MYYNFHNKLLDLTTFIELKRMGDIKPILNSYFTFHTYQDVFNYADNDKFYTTLPKNYEVIKDFLQHPFFKVYTKVNDISIWKQLMIEVITNDEYYKASMACNKFNEAIFTNKSIESFLRYNRKFRDNANKLDTKKYFDLEDTEREFFNFRENFTTFRISNSLMNLSNDKIKEKIKLEEGQAVFEIDIKASDWFFILFMNFLQKRNTNIIAQVAKRGVYDLIKMDSGISHAQQKLNILASMYSLNKNASFTDFHMQVIRDLQIENLMEYIVDHESIILPNGFYRTAQYNIALYGQTLTSIFVMRFIFNSLMKYLEKIGGKCLLSKHDSIIFVANERLEFNRDEFHVDIKGNTVNYCGDDYLLTESDEKIFNVVFKTNYKINKL